MPTDTPFLFMLLQHAQLLMQPVLAIKVLTHSQPSGVTRTALSYGESQTRQKRRPGVSRGSQCKRICTKWCVSSNYDELILSARNECDCSEV